jgi:hypothetical protein
MLLSLWRVSNVVIMPNAILLNAILLNAIMPMPLCLMLLCLMPLCLMPLSLMPSCQVSLRHHAECGTAQNGILQDVLPDNANI